MKHILIIFSLLFSMLLTAQAPKGKATVGTVYGQKIDEVGAMSSTDIYPMIANGDTTFVKIKTKVLTSCASEGCWLTFFVNDSLPAIAKMKDHAFFVPLDIQGKTVVMDGKCYMKITSVKELKHLAEDAKKSKKEIDAITQPKKQIVFVASGVLVVRPD
ncbi:MAG: DUF4920 domain-containing protein [Bacteroidia bacterium]|jgi:hypothetical protein|nr:DUF4920 domain-containing protein [Bacteroidia bacterium]